MKIQTPDTREIKLIPKYTNATTQYYEMGPEDESYLYNWMIRFLADIAEEATHDLGIQSEFFKRLPKKFPKGTRGPNSFASMLGGIVSAKVSNANHNVSEPWLEPIEEIFETMSGYYSKIDNPPKPIKFRKSLFVRE